MSEIQFRDEAYISVGNDNITRVVICPSRSPELFILPKGSSIVPCLPFSQEAVSPIRIEIVNMQEGTD